MKVFYDSQIFGRQDYGGISRYFTEIIKRFSEKDVKAKVNLTISHNHYIKDLKIGHFDKIFFKSRYRNYLYSAINMVIGVPELIFTDYDIFHPTYYETYFLPFVVTVYDMIHELFFREYPNLDKKLMEKKKLLFEKAIHIIAISKSTKNDIVKIYNIDPKKITVVYLANSLLPWDKKKKLKLPKRYILYVGHRWIYKNFVKFVNAEYKLLVSEDTALVCAGGNSFSSEETELFEDLSITDRVFYVPIKKDRDLSECYSRAEAFVYPSRYEGFGIPILEAFANECPVICSDLSSFPEVAKNAAVYFDPDRRDSVESAVKKVLGDVNLRQKMVKLGRKRLRNFSWDKTTSETAAVYKKVYSNHE
jgi:glycosyltransferase involved in cell wall biosynthesis